MRSEMVYLAGQQIQNRFLLASVAMKAVKRLHRDSTRTEDTANRIFGDIAGGRYVEVSTPKVTPAPALGQLLIEAA